VKVFIGSAFLCLIIVALIASFSDELGLDILFPGFDAAKTVTVGVLFLALAIAGLFHRYNKFKKK